MTDSNEVAVGEDVGTRDCLSDDSKVSVVLHVAVAISPCGHHWSVMGTCCMEDHAVIAELEKAMGEKRGGREIIGFLDIPVTWRRAVRESVEQGGKA